MLFGEPRHPPALLAELLYFRFFGKRVLTDNGSILMLCPASGDGLTKTTLHQTDSLGQITMKTCYRTEELNRVEINRALAKAIAYKQCGQQHKAEMWAAMLIDQLACANILTPAARNLALEV
jgi:hypothetical protein